MQSQHSSSAKPHSSASRHPQRGGVEGNGNPTRQAHHRAPFTQNGTGTPSYSHPSPSSAYRAGPPPDSTVLAEEALSDPWGYDVVPGGQGRHYHDQFSSFGRKANPDDFYDPDAGLRSYPKEVMDEWHRTMSYNNPNAQYYSPYFRANPGHSSAPVQLQPFYDAEQMGGASSSASQIPKINYFITNPTPGQPTRPIIMKRAKRDTSAVPRDSFDGSRSTPRRS